MNQLDFNVPKDFRFRFCKAALWISITAVLANMLIVWITSQPFSLQNINITSGGRGSIHTCNNMVILYRPLKATMAGYDTRGADSPVQHP